MQKIKARVLRQHEIVLGALWWKKNSHPDQKKLKSIAKKALTFNFYNPTGMIKTETFYGHLHVLSNEAIVKFLMFKFPDQTNNLMDGLRKARNMLAEHYHGRWRKRPQIISHVLT